MKWALQSHSQEEEAQEGHMSTQMDPNKVQVENATIQMESFWMAFHLDFLNLELPSQLVAAALVDFGITLMALVKVQEEIAMILMETNLILCLMGFSMLVFAFQKV